MAMFCTSCQMKGMYVAKNGVPVPYNMSLMKKSARDTQDAVGPGYAYHSETIDGDETIIPSTAVRAWMWSSIGKSVANGFSNWSGNKAKTDQINSTNAAQTAQNASNNATVVEQAKIAADAAKTGQ